MSLLPVLTIATRNIFRNRRRTLITILTVTVGIWSALSLSALARGVSTQLREDAIQNFVGHIKIHAVNYADDPVLENSFSSIPPELGQLLASPGLKSASRLRVPGVVMSEYESTGVTILGITPEQEAGLSFLPDSISTGRFLASSADPGIVIGEELAELLETGLGKRIVLMSEGSDNQIADRGFTIVGIFRAELDATELQFVGVGIDVLREMLGAGNSNSEISIKLDRVSEITPLLAKLRSAAPEFDIRGWDTLEPFVAAILKVQGGFLHLWFGVVVVAISFGLVNTLFMSILERVRELGLMLALGLKPWLIRVQIVWESMLLLVSGVVLGNVLALCTVHFFEGGIDLGKFAEGAAKVGLRNVVHPNIILNDWINANVMALVLGALASLYPAWRASRFSPMDALRKT